MTVEYWNYVESSERHKVTMSLRLLPFYEELDIRKLVVDM